MNFLNPLKTLFTAPGKGRTIREVFHEAVNFRWDPVNNDFLWYRSYPA